MRIITPITVDDTSLKYSSIPENDDGYPEWEIGFEYNEHIILLDSFSPKIWRKSGGTYTYQEGISTDQTGVYSLAVSPDQKYLILSGANIAGGSDNYTHLLYQRKITSSYVTYEYVSSIGIDANGKWQFSEDGRFAMLSARITSGTHSGYYGCRVFYFDDGFVHELTFPGGKPFRVFDASISRDSRFLAVVADYSVNIYEILDRYTIQKVDTIPENNEYEASTNPSYRQCVFSPSDNILIVTAEMNHPSSYEGFQVYSYNIDGICTYESDGLGINAASELDNFTDDLIRPSFSPDGRYLAMGSAHNEGVGAASVYFYSWGGTSFTKLADAATVSDGANDVVTFSTDGYAHIGKQAADYFQIYEPAFEKITDPLTMPSGRVRDVVCVPASSYGKGSVVRIGNYLYESLISNNRRSPSENVTVAAWIELSPINRWKMFDAYANTATTEDGQITVQIEAEGIEHIGSLGLSGASEVTVTRYNSSDVSQWTTTESTTNTDRIIIDLDEATGGSGDYVEVVIGSSMDDDVSVARCFPGGAAVTYPNLQYGMEYSPMSFGKTIENDFGNVYLKQGNYADEFDCQVIISNTSIDTMFKFFRDYRETSLLWDLNGSTTDYEFLITYGFYLGRPRFVMQHPNDSIVNFKIREFT